MTQTQEFKNDSRTIDMGWFKFRSRYWLSNQEIRGLEFIERDALCSLYCLANELLAEGRYLLNKKIPFPKKSIIDMAFINEREFDRLHALGFISFENNIYYITDWKLWQGESERVMASRNKITGKVTPLRSKTEEVKIDKFKTPQEVGGSLKNISTNDTAQQVINYYLKKHDMYFGGHYVPNKSQEIKVAKTLIECFGTLDAIKQKIDLAFDSDDRITKNLTSSFNTLATAINRLNAHGYEKKNSWDYHKNRKSKTQHDLKDLERRWIDNHSKKESSPEGMEEWTEEQWQEWSEKRKEEGNQEISL